MSSLYNKSSKSIVVYHTARLRRLIKKVIRELNKSVLRCVSNSYKITHGYLKIYENYLHFNIDTYFIVTSLLITLCREYLLTCLPRINIFSYIIFSNNNNKKIYINDINISKPKEN